MSEHSIPELAKNVFLVGVKDWNTRLFDSLIPLPHGTSYNSYLIRGNEKNALIDTVRPGFEKELVDKISKLIDLSKLDYVVMNHAEPDHAGALPVIMQLTKAKLVTTQKGAEAAKLYYNIPHERIQTIKEGDSINLGGKTLKFIDAPFLHWPETMFTYLLEDSILFPCDFFGSHTSFGIYDSEAEDLIINSKRYFGEIMMPFKAMGKKAIDKLQNLDIKMIAPSHGPIHKTPKNIIDAYKKWTAGETKEKAIIVYATMWKSTEKMVDAIMQPLMEEGIEIVRYNLANADIGDIAKDLVDSRAIILGAPTVLGSLHPLAVYAFHLVKILNPPLKYGVILNSYGWGSAAVKNIIDALPKHIEPVGAIEINGTPKEEDIKNVIELGKKLAKKIKTG